MISDILVAGFMVIGSFFIFIAALGMVRFPDLYTRMHAASKSISLGIGCMLIGPVFYFSSITIMFKAMAVVVFIFLTMPVASHMISRVAYKRKVGIYEQTRVDELKEG